jgi:hypothetical protein
LATHQKIRYHNHKGFVSVIQEWISVTHHINIVIGKNHMIISTDTEKYLSNSEPLHVKNTQENRTRKQLLNMIEDIYEKSTVSIIVNGEKK